jgi:hypothetical protein
MSTKQNVSTYAKKLFSEAEPQAIIIDADNVSREDLMNVINEATDSVEEETGSRLYAELYRDNFTSRLFAEVEKADQNGGGEIDLDKAAEDAIDDTNKQLEETEETKKQSYMSKYFSGLEDENYEGDVIDEGNLIESEVRAQALYEAGFNDALRYFSEVEGEDGDEDEDEVTEEEKVVAQSALANDYFTVWTKVFADAKEEGASDTEAAAEATEEASKATGIAEEDEDEEAGNENNFIFGLTADEVHELNAKGGYNPWEVMKATEGLERVMNSLIDGTFSSDLSMFQELYNSLMYGMDGNRPDEYYLLKDFASYREAQRRVDEAYRDKYGWAKKAWINISNGGKFSSDRTILEYANEIWNIKQVKVK